MSALDLDAIEATRAKAVQALEAGLTAGAFMCVTPLMVDMPKLLEECRRLRAGLTMIRDSEEHQGWAANVAHYALEPKS